VQASPHHTFVGENSHTFLKHRLPLGKRENSSESIEIVHSGGGRKGKMGRRRCRYAAMCFFATDLACIRWGNIF